MVEWLESQGKQVYFVSNNATKSPAVACQKMLKMGLASPKVDNYFGTARVVAHYLQEKHPSVKKVFVVGMKSIRE